MYKNITFFNIWSADFRKFWQRRVKYKIYIKTEVVEYYDNIIG